MCNHSPKLGSIARAVPYLFAPVDSRQRVRERVELLYGDAQQLIDLVNTLPVSHGKGPGSAYDSIVLSFSPCDKPSRKQIRQIVAAMPDLLFPKGADRVCWLAKLHSHGSNTHLHVLCAQVDLKTGRHYSLRGFGLRPLKEFCRVLNRHHGWADPEDEFRGRLAWWSEDVVGAGLSPSTGIHAHARALAIAAVLNNQVVCQVDMVRVLQPLGTLVHTGRYSITLEVAGVALAELRAATVVRLTGILYARNFDRSKVLRALAPAPLPAALTRRDTPLEDKQLAQELLDRMHRANLRRAEALAERYAVKLNRARRSLVTRMAWEIERNAPPPEIDLHQRLPMAPSTTTYSAPVRASAPVSVYAPIPIPIHVQPSANPHELTSHTHHRVLAAGNQRVSAGAGFPVGRAAPSADLPGLGRAIQRSIGVWIEDSLVPSIVKMARRAVDTVLDNVLRVQDPAVRQGRDRSAP